MTLLLIVCALYPVMKGEWTGLEPLQIVVRLVDRILSVRARVASIVVIFLECVQVVVGCRGRIWAWICRRILCHTASQ